MNFEERFERTQEICEKFSNLDVYCLLENMRLFKGRNELKKLNMLFVSLIGINIEEDEKIKAILEDYAEPWMLETIWQMGIIPDSRLFEIVSKTMDLDEIDLLFERIFNLKFGELNKMKIFDYIYNSPYKNYLAININDTDNLDDYMELLKLISIDLKNPIGIGLLKNLLFYVKKLQDESEEKRNLMQKIESLLYYQSEISRNVDSKSN